MRHFKICLFLEMDNVKLIGTVYASNAKGVQRGWGHGHVISYYKEYEDSLRLVVVPTL